MIFLESSRNLTEYSQVDIRSVAQGKIENVSDEQIQRLIENPKPRKGFEFAAREYTNNRRPDGKMNSYCNPEWFDMYKFLAYSEEEDGVYCLSCIFFSDPAQKWFWRSKTYHGTLYKLEESCRLSVQLC